MTKKTAGLLLVILFPIAPSLSGQSRVPATLVKTPDFSRTPLYFVEARGQAKAPALYYARTSRYTLWLTREGLVFDFKGTPSDPTSRRVLRLDFSGARPDASVETLVPSDYRVSEFRGRDARDWTTDVPAARAVLYRGIYEGIDLKVYGNERGVEYDWIVHPGAKHEAIRLSPGGCRTARIAPGGDLILECEGAEIRQSRPRAYQEVDGRKVEIASRFEARGKRDFGFVLGAYDKTRDLVIDPWVMGYSTYLGGSELDAIYDIAVDAAGAIYVTGLTQSAQFPVMSQASEAAATNDIFVAKLNPAGDALDYTFIFAVGRAMYAPRSRIAIDAAGAAYVGGETATEHFPVKNAFQSRHGGGGLDAFVLKIAAGGRGLIYSSFLGGGSGERIDDITVDAKGSAYLTGMTYSRDFPRKKAFQYQFTGANEGYVAKVSPDGLSLEYSTYLGGNYIEEPTGIAVDSAGSAYVTGVTYSRTFPIKFPIQSRMAGISDMFVTKFAPDGRSLVYSTYLGGPGQDFGGGIAVAADGTAVIAGQTLGTFPLRKAFQAERKGKTEGVVAKLSASGRELIFSTYLGGAGLDYFRHVAVDDEGIAYVAGQTESRDFPRKMAYQPGMKGSRDAVLAAFAADGRSLVFSTFLGGAYRDAASALALGADGAIYVAGETNSVDFPVAEPYQEAFAGGDNDGFVSKLVWSQTAPTPNLKKVRKRLSGAGETLETRRGR
jgi:hypothetical protein